MNTEKLFVGSNGFRLDRDLNGTRGILIKSLVEHPSITLGDTPSISRSYCALLAFVSKIVSDVNLLKPIYPEFPQLFKGIALFTPGGDLIYCIDASKKQRWHLHLCVELQEVLGLSEPPHFLIPGYAATIDKWLDASTQQVQVLAEAHAPVLKYQPLLNAIFQTGDLVWQPAPWSEEFCNPMVIATSYERFPQLWENHNLVVSLNQQEFDLDSLSEEISTKTINSQPEVQGYVLRLFVSGKSIATERILQSLHQMLERYLSIPYTLRVIDVFKHPEQAEADLITATPTLIRVWPLPVRRIVGEFNNLETIIKLLENNN